MSRYTVTHLYSGETLTRPSILLNSHQSQRDWQLDVDPAVEAFHQQLPGYGETRLRSLPSVASELGFRHVFLKDESTRFDLPSFKILGASWAVHQAVCQRLGLPSSTSLADLQETLRGRSSDVRLVTCTDGNWGRAVARMAKYLGVPIRIYVPGFTIEYTQNLLRGEGAEVMVLEGGTYDDAIAAVQQHAESIGALMVLDTSWKGYEEVPGVSLHHSALQCLQRANVDNLMQWVTEGYETMLAETDRQIATQTGGQIPSLVIGSVGVGSWMHAVTLHYRSISPTTCKVVTVEPDTAACLKESLHCGQLMSIKTRDTIMCGMNCGTPSEIAWSVLRDGVSMATTVTDVQSHESVQYLQSQGMNAGPCGAATLAALRNLCAENRLEHRGDMVAVLFSTEGMREYEVPK